MKNKIIIALIINLLLLMFPARDVFTQSILQQQYIDKAYIEWVKTTNAKDIEKWSSFLAPDAIFHPPNHSALVGNEAIKNFYSDLFTDENFSLNCIQEKVEISYAEDFAWSSGRCSATFTSPEGKEGHAKSKWIKVWERSPKGEWRCKISSWNLIPQKEMLRVLDAPGTIFKYTAEGDGEPCVAFTGGENLGNRTYSDRLRERLTLIYADPSHLDSQRISEITLDMILEDIEKVRQFIGTDKIGVIGHSMFGTLPLEYALKYPNSISLSISTGARPFKTQKYKDIVKEYWRSTASKERKKILKDNLKKYSELNLDDLTPTERFVEYYTANIPKFCFDPHFDMSEYWGDVEINTNFLNHFANVIMNDYDNSEAYSEIKSPALVIAGRHDYWAPYTLWDEIREKNLNLTFHLFDSAGHNPSLEIPEKFDDFVINWIKNLVKD